MISKVENPLASNIFLYIRVDGPWTSQTTLSKLCLFDAGGSEDVVMAM